MQEIPARGGRILHQAQPPEATGQVDASEGHGPSIFGGPPRGSWVHLQQEAGLPPLALPQGALGGSIQVREPHGPRGDCFTEAKGTKTLDVKDLWALSPGLTGTSSSVIKVPHLHRSTCPPFPGVTPETSSMRGEE